MPESLLKVCAQRVSRLLSPKRHPPPWVAPLQRSKRSRQRTLTTLRSRASWGSVRVPLLGTVCVPSSGSTYLPQGCREASLALITLLTSATGKPDVDPKPSAAQADTGPAARCRKRRSCWVWVRHQAEIYSPPASCGCSKPSAIHPTLYMPFVPSLRHNCSLGWPKIYAYRYTKRWQLRERLLLWISRLGACHAVFGSCSIIPQGLEPGQGHHVRLGCQALDRQHLSSSKSLRTLSSLPCRESSQRLPRSDLRRSVPLLQSRTSTAKAAKSFGSGWPKLSFRPVFL